MPRSLAAASFASSKIEFHYKHEKLHDSDRCKFVLIRSCLVSEIQTELNVPDFKSPVLQTCSSFFGFFLLFFRFSLSGSVVRRDVQ